MKKYALALETIETDRILVKDFLTALLFCSTYSIGTAIAEEVPATLPPMVVAAPQADSDETEPGEDASEQTSSADNRDSTHLTQQDLSVAHERSVDEVLRGLPGLGITKGGNFGLGMVYARGASGQGLITLDGLPVPDTLPGVVNLNALLPDSMERIDVRRGFSPAARPFSALGGSIDMISRTADDNSADLRVEGGTFGFLKETLRGNLAGDKARIAITVNRSDAFDGAYHAQKSNNNPERDPFHGTQTLMKAGLDLSEDVIWEGSMLYRDSWNGWDGYGIRNGDLAMADEKGAFLAEQSWMAQNSLKARISADWNTRLQVGYTHTDNHAQVMGIRPGYTTDLYLARWENEQRLWQDGDKDAVYLIWGAEGRHEWAEAPTFSPPPGLISGPIFSEGRNQQAGFLETRFVFGKMSGDLGVRYESYDRFHSPALVKAGIAWQALETLKLRANAGNGFRIPSYAERLFPLLGNLNLQPERGAGGDLGVEWQALSMLKLTLTGFYNRYDNLIVVSWVPAPSAQIPCIGECISNVANASVAGMEADGEITFNDQWRGGAAYTYTDSRNLDTGGVLPFQAKNVVRVWGEWQASSLPLTLWVEGIYRSLAQNDLGNTLDVDDAFHLNVHANYQLTSQLNLYVRGENLNNDETPDAFSFDRRGAAVYGGVILKL